MTCAGFTAVRQCWICGSASLTPVHEAIFELSEYARQDPELAAYTGQQVSLQRCASCGFAQPVALPALPRFFDRMYDQRWSEDWIVREHEAVDKDLIFDDVLRSLAARVPAGRRRLLDVGAHAGRFMRLAGAAGWNAEGLELNPRTAAFAARATGAAVHQGNIYDFDGAGGCYDALTLTDVLEHVPEPRAVLERAAGLICRGGWIAVKVPNGAAQRIKEHIRARLRSGYRATLADNLVHVNHFSAWSLRLALERSHFGDVVVVAGAPELPPAQSAHSRGARLARLAAYRLARAVPGGARLPLAFNLQAYGRRV